MVKVKQLRLIRWRNRLRLHAKTGLARLSIARAERKRNSAHFRNKETGLLTSICRADDITTRFFSTFSIFCDRFDENIEPPRQGNGVQGTIASKTPLDLIATMSLTSILSLKSCARVFFGGFAFGGAVAGHFSSETTDYRSRRGPAVKRRNRRLSSRFIRPTRLIPPTNR